MVNQCPFVLSAALFNFLLQGSVLAIGSLCLFSVFCLEVSLSYCSFRFNLVDGTVGDSGLVGFSSEAEPFFTDRCEGVLYLFPFLLQRVSICIRQSFEFVSQTDGELLLVLRRLQLGDIEAWTLCVSLLSEPCNFDL